MFRGGSWQLAVQVSIALSQGPLHNSPRFQHWAERPLESGWGAGGGAEDGDI
jgi:hypothetical protein